MEKFFSSFGKIALIAVLFAGLMGAGYYLGKSGKVSIIPPSALPKAASTEQVVPFFPPPTQTATPAALIAPPMIILVKTVSAGVPASAGLAFGPYTIQTPDGWTAAREFDNGIPMDTLTITKGVNQLKIYQAATGGGICLYPSDTPFDGPSSNYTDYVDITAANGSLFRRGTTAGSSGTKGFTVCQKSASNPYQAPTTFGHISINVALDAPNNILQEIDAMIASMKK